MLTVDFLKTAMHLKWSILLPLFCHFDLNEVNSKKGTDTAGFENLGILNLEHQINFSKMQYFQYLRKYFGTEIFESNKCLKEQEKNGWHLPSDNFPLKLFNLGIEGSGHHLVEVCEPHGLYDSRQLFL